MSFRNHRLEWRLSSSGPGTFKRLGRVATISERFAKSGENSDEDLVVYDDPPALIVLIFKMNTARRARSLNERLAAGSSLIGPSEEIEDALGGYL